MGFVLARSLAGGVCGAEVGGRDTQEDSGVWMRARLQTAGWRGRAGPAYLYRREGRTFFCSSHFQV